MKETMRKIMLVITVIFFGVFSSLAYPMQQAQAGPIAGGLVPGGITIGAGAYTLGGLALAGLVGAVGYDEYSEEINAHALRAWENGTQLSKDSMNFMIQSAAGAGTALTEIPTDLKNFLEKEYKPQIQADLAKILTNNLNAGTSTINSTAIYNAEPYVGQYMTVQLQHSLTNDMKMFINGKGYTNLYVTASFNLLNPTSSINRIEIKSGSNTIHDLWSAGSTSKAALSILTNLEATSTAQFLGAAALSGASVSLQNADGTVVDDWSNYQQGVSQIEEAWTSMRDAGLVLPVDGITSHVGDVQVRANEAGDSYTDDAGAVYAPGDVTHSFPQPRIRTQDVPVPGVYTDTPALTGNPAIDEPIVANPDIPKTTTNVHTGVTIANPDIATGNPAIPTDPPITDVPPLVPPFDSPGTTGLDFTPLMMTGEAMTNKFPFSIPFDFVRQIRVFDVEPVAPSFDIDIPEFIKLGGFVIPFKMKLSFEMFDPIANIIRWGMIIIWDISLIFAIRKLLPE